ncbi:MAG: hypothetical protein AB1468_01485 [Candidatus Micrarchaeota archaeon]
MKKMTYKKISLSHRKSHRKNAKTVDASVVTPEAHFSRFFSDAACTPFRINTETSTVGAFMRAQSMFDEKGNADDETKKDTSEKLSEKLDVLLKKFKTEQDEKNLERYVLKSDVSSM